MRSAAIGRLRRPRALARAGVQVVELVIVVLVVGILTAVAAPKFVDSLDRLRVESAAERIQADLDLIRQHAIASSGDQVVQFTADSDSYTMSGIDDLDQPGETYFVDLSDATYSADITDADLGGDAEVVFDHFGQPDSGGVVSVAVGSYVQTVTIDADTGVASIP